MLLRRMMAPMMRAWAARPWPRRGPPAPSAAHLSIAERVRAAALGEQAARHYARGNRFFDLRALDLALAEWRQAGALWRGTVPRRTPGLLLELRAIVMLLLTVLLIYNGIYLIYPRDQVELLGVGDSSDTQDAGGWWGQWLEGDGKGPGKGPAKGGGIGGWWRSLARRLAPPQQEPPAEPSPLNVKAQWEQLLVQYGRLGLLNPSDLDYHLISGYGLSQQGEQELAIAAFEQGLQSTHKPKRQADLYQGLANTYYAKGYHLGADGLARYDLAQVRKAAGAYESAIKLEPRALSYGNLGWMYYVLGRYSQAEQYSGQALSLEPGLEYVRLNLGLILLVQGRIPDAYQAYQEVIRGKPEDDVFSGGINDLREVLRDRPGRHPHAELMLGLLAAGQGDAVRARQALKHFLAWSGAEARWRQVANDALSGLARRRPPPAKGA